MQKEAIQISLYTVETLITFTGMLRIQDLALNVRCRLLSYISCAASSRTCQHVAVHRTAKYAVQEPTCFQGRTWNKDRGSIFTVLKSCPQGTGVWCMSILPPHQIRFGEMKNCNNRSFCHILLWGSRSTLALRLCSLQPYVPLRAGRCESLPHRSHMTGSDDGQSCLHKPQLDEGVADM